ncbi:hypothetical protein [Peribacillus simplex]|uniref:hypothetical protein n=1 Tax=Peribacillus simplex TaxID=1478 RepID=UPI0033395250
MFVLGINRAEEKPMKEIAKDVRKGQKIRMNKKIIETPSEMRGIICKRILVKGA